MSSGRKIRLLTLAAFLVTLFVLSRVAGANDYFSTEKLHTIIRSSGIWGVLAFLMVFAVGQLMYLPGLMFVAAAVFAYGRFSGGGLSYAGAVLSVLVSFTVVRTIGGRAFEEIDRPLMKRILRKLDSMPIRSVAILRLVFIMNPALNYALGLSNIRFRDYAVGSALGLIIPIAIATLCFDLLF